MSTADLPDITLTFTLAAEAPVAPSGWYLLGPSFDHDWSIGYHTDEEGWALADGDLIDEPPFVAALPVVLLNVDASALKRLASAVAEQLGAGRFDRAARLIDELADEVRAVRDRPRRLATEHPHA
jgi:hypothetical protein